MSSELIDQHDATASSLFLGENCSVSEGQVCEPKFERDHQRTRHGMVAVPCSPLGSSSPIQKSLLITTQSVNHLEEPPSIMAWEKMERQPLGTESASISKALKQLSHSSMKSSSYNINESKSLTTGMLHEASLFSSSLSEVFNRKLRLSGNDVKFNQHSSTFVSQSEEELFESLEEVEVQTIGNLLPDEDDLFSGVTDELGRHVHGNNGDEFEDFDLFSSGGGMELGDDHLHIGNRNYEFVQGVSNGKWGCNGSVVSEHPSRTLFVQNINSNIEDSQLKALFQQYGDIWTLYTTCKHRGFVMITYYDIRAARNAMRALQNKPVMQMKLDIHYSIPKDNPSEKDIHQGILVICNLDSSVSNDDLRKLFGLYGEIKKIREAPYKPHNKFIEFYDVRAAESALHALNKSEIGGKQIKLELAPPGDARHSLMQVPDLEQDEPNIYHNPGGNLSSTLKVIASSCTVNSSSQGLYSTKLLPMNTLNQNTASGHSSSFPNTFPYPVGMTLSGEQFGICESNNSLEKIEFANQCIPSFHPHSFPEHHDIQRNTSITLGSMATGGLGVSVVDNRLSGGSTNRHPMELSGGVFGSPANGSCPVPEHHYTLNKTNSYQQHRSSPMRWQNSPSFVNGPSSHCFPQIPGFPRTPPQMLGSASPLSHHIGSAPAVNPSLWEIHAYSGEHSEASSIHHSSLGGVGFPGSPQFHPLDISSRNIISQVGRNCMGMTTNTVQRSSQHVGHIFQGRNEMISGIFDSLNERTRNPFPRRNDVNSSNTKQYELDIDRILRGEDSRTTLMIKNIPNKYTSKMLLAAIDERCRGTYDFLYLPIDFKNKCNVGYAFINMIDPRQIATFYQAFNGKKWEKFNSEKVACLAYARIQGKTALIAHFQNSSLMNEDKRCRPILFHTNGPNAGDPEPFPMGTNIRSRQGNPRMSINEENNNQGSPAETSCREETSRVSTDQTGQMETNYYI